MTKMHIETSRRIARKLMGLKPHDPRIVHHIDENPFNNNINNLQIMKSIGSHMRLHNKGKKLTNEHIKKISQTQIGSKNNMYGRKGQLSPTYKGGKPKCIGCGGKVSSYTTKRCRKCDSQHKQLGEYKVCMNCGKEVYKKRRELENFKIFFCCIKCMRKFKTNNKKK